MNGPFAWLTNLLGSGNNGGMMGANPMNMGGVAPQQSPLNPVQPSAPGTPAGLLGRVGNAFGLNNGPNGYSPSQNQISPANSPVNPNMRQNMAMNQAMNLMRQPQIQPAQWMPWMQQR